MMSEYQKFLDYFSMHNKERLDGLSECYFTAMSPAERANAFDYLMGLMAHGGSEEVVHGLFKADSHQAVPIIEDLLAKGALREEAEIAAAWNLNRISASPNLQRVFIRHFLNPNSELRGKAAY